MPPITLGRLSLLSFFLFIASTAAVLDPHQRAALHSLGFPTAGDDDPCGNTTFISCSPSSSSSSFLSVTSLLLSHCNWKLPLSSLLPRLPSLSSLSFLHCPAFPPASFPSRLRSFSCLSSLHHLSFSLLSPLHNLTSLTVSSIPIHASSLAILISHMPHLAVLSLTGTNLSGPIPHHWHASLSLSHLNLSSNLLSGTIPDSISTLASLQNLSLSGNKLSGEIPSSLRRLSNLTHLDLSNNRVNGSIPSWLADMPNLRTLILENNDLKGPIPFNSTAIQRLDIFSVSGNVDLCYNRTAAGTGHKMVKISGIAPCDKYGYPLTPPGRRQPKADDDDEYDDGSSSTAADVGGGKKGGNKVALGVAIGLACLVFIVLFILWLSKICR